MHKIYKTPSVRVVILDDTDLIATSDPGRSYSLGTNGGDTRDSDKAPNRSIWGDD